jgi:hypothetical protein
MTVVSRNCTSIAPTLPAFETNHCSADCKYGVSSSQRCSGAIAASPLQRVAILAPMSGNASTHFGGSGNSTDSRLRNSAVIPPALCTIVISASSTGTKTASRRMTVTTATASFRRPPRAASSLRKNGHEATVTMVAQSIAIRNGLRTQKLDAMSSASNSTDRVVWVRSDDAVLSAFILFA